jgi:hypothetical protein
MTTWTPPADLIDAYVEGRTDFPTDPQQLGPVIHACTPEQRSRLRRRIGIEMSLADFGDLWSRAVTFANRLDG